MIFDSLSRPIKIQFPQNQILPPGNLSVHLPKMALSHTQEKPTSELVLNEFLPAPIHRPSLHTLTVRLEGQHSNWNGI